MKSRSKLTDYWIIRFADDDSANDKDRHDQTDKMLSRKEGGVGYVIFNNPEKLNAVSLDMWEATKRILDDFVADNDIRVVVLTGAGGKAFVSGADISKFESERANLEAARAYGAKSEAAYASIYEFPKPTIAMIRGYCIGGGLGLATCCDLRICHRQFALRGAGGQARAGLRLCRPEAAGRRRRPGLRQGNLLHRAPVRRPGGARHGPRQPRGAVGRARNVRENHHRHDLRQRAAHHQGGEDTPSTKSSRKNPSATSRAPPKWWRSASPATTTTKAAPPSWKSASRSLPAREGSIRRGSKALPTFGG